MNDNNVAIIGAGPAGLTTARALKLLNIPFTVYEKHSDVGGIWDITNPGTPMYKSAHFISSKTLSGHAGFPMPAHFPDYPSRVQIHEYIQNFAKEYELYDEIRFNSRISQVHFQDNLWHITTEQGETEAYRWLVCASGSLWDPNRPHLQGEEDFHGEIMHGVHYKDSDYLKGKRVLVVGAGNSGVDIACDAAFAAEKAYISTRRGYHFVPKHIFGMPVDVFGHKTGGGPMWLSQWIFTKLLRFVNGDLTQWGLQAPDHKVLSTHPIVNSQLLHYLQHGDVIAKNDIDYLKNDTVFFKDGSSEEIDLIIMATGYKFTIPYLDKHFFEWKGNRPQLYLKIFNGEYPTLFANGYFESNGGGYSLMDETGYVIAKVIESQLHETPQATAIIKTFNEPSPDLTGSIQLVDSDRHTGYANKDTYLHELEKFRKKWGWGSLENLLQASTYVQRKQKNGQKNGQKELTYV
jgi:Flavin-binding monooxygenase-like